MRAILLLLLLSSLATAAPPTIVSCPGPAQVMTAVTTNINANKAIVGHGQQSIAFEVTGSSTATAQVIACCNGACDTSGTWVPVGASGAITSNTGFFSKIDWPPACLFTVNIAANIGTVNAWVVCGGP